jgi:hypothetical protein
MSQRSLHAQTYWCLTSGTGACQVLRVLIVLVSLRLGSLAWQPKIDAVIVRTSSLRLVFGGIPALHHLARWAVHGVT